MKLGFFGRVEGFRVQAASFSEEARQAPSLSPQKCRFQPRSLDIQLNLENPVLSTRPAASSTSGARWWRCAVPLVPNLEDKLPK